MMLRRSLLTAAMPVASALVLAGPALARSSAPPVSFRVQGPTTTLLETRTVLAPSHGSITKAHAPKGACPADSAAGALNVATRGRWGGVYSTYGIEVNKILGTTVDDTTSYWAFFVNNRYASKGVCDTPLRRGDKLLFAVVPATGPTELPIVLKVPHTVKAGVPFTVRTFVFSGKGNATTPVTPTVTSTHPDGNGNVGGLTTGASSDGTTTLTLATPGTATLLATAPGEITSAAKTITVTK